jgi:hypothetical protein
MGIMAKQMMALKESGLEEAASEIYIGVNGDESEAFDASEYAPSKSQIIPHGRGSASELTTLHYIQKWLRPGWNVCYHHIKGATHPGSKIWESWRNCMERVVIWNWRDCVRDLEHGFDTAGAHWMSSEKYAIIDPSQRYWGGNFWWATSEHLLKLPTIQANADNHNMFYEAEVWIGKSPGKIRTMDYARHFPMKGCA